MPNVDAKWMVRRVGPDRFEGTIVINIGGAGSALAPVAIKTKGRSKREAISRAASVAKAITQNPLVASVLPPGTGLAVEAISRLAKSKDIGAALQSFKGEGAKRLANALGF